MAHKMTLENWLRPYTTKQNKTQHIITQYEKNPNFIIKLMKDELDQIYPYEDIIKFMIDVIFRNNLKLLYPFVICNYLALYRLIPTDLFSKTDIDTINIYEYSEDNSLVMRILDKYDVPIKEDNFYLLVVPETISSRFQLKYYSFEDKNEEKYNILKYYIDLSEYMYLPDVENPYLHILFNFTQEQLNFNEIFTRTVYNNRVISTESVSHTAPSNIDLWKKCFTNIYGNDPDFAKILSFYTNTGDTFMHSVLRKTFIPELSPYNNVENIIRNLNILNYKIYNSKRFMSIYCNKLNLKNNIKLFRGISNVEGVLTRGSILNNMRNQFVSFSSEFQTATEFGTIIYSLTLTPQDLEKYFFVPIENIKNKSGKSISEYDVEHEWLFPLNTSFEIVNVMKYLKGSDVIIVDIKIHNQEYIRDVTPDTFTKDMLANVFLNKEKFIYNLCHDENGDIIP